MSDELKAMLRQAPMNGFAIRTLAYIEKLEAQLAARCSADSAEEKMPVARPVAFRVPRVVNDRLSKTEFRLFDDEDEARRAACDIGADYDGLFLVADRRAAFFAQPRPSTEPQSAPAQGFPNIPDDDGDFTPDLARSIVAMYQNLISAETSRADENSRSLHETMARVVHIRELAEQIIEMRWLLEPQSQADSSPQTAGAESHSPAAMEGEKDTIVNLIHEHVGFEVLLAIESGVLTGVEDAAEAILAELGRRSQADNVTQSAVLIHTLTDIAAKRFDVNARIEDVCDMAESAIALTRPERGET